MHSFSIRIASGIFLLWATIAVVAVLVTFALTARRDLRPADESTAPIVTSEAGEPARPPGVPIDATLVTGDTVLGSVSTPAPGAGDAPHVFYWLTCEDELLTISTTQETVYAQVDCGRYWLVHEVVRPYQGQPVQIRVGVGPSPVLVMEASAAGAAEFDIDAVWVRSNK